MWSKTGHTFHKCYPINFNSCMKLLCFSLKLLIFYNMTCQLEIETKMTFTWLVFDSIWWDIFWSEGLNIEKFEILGKIFKTQRLLTQPTQAAKKLPNLSPVIKCCFEPITTANRVHVTHFQAVNNCQG